MNPLVGDSGILVRGVSTYECPWLSRPMEAGEVVYQWLGWTFNAISENGVAVVYNKNGFVSQWFEIPKQVVLWSGHPRIPDFPQKKCKLCGPIPFAHRNYGDKFTCKSCGNTFSYDGKNWIMWRGYEKENHDQQQ